MCFGITDVGTARQIDNSSTRDIINTLPSKYRKSQTERNQQRFFSLSLTSVAILSMIINENIYNVK